ncbi:MAG TPA: tRNA lysidine(34) synthetase TilS [Pyrinomonadaceae bacterium]|nr:tRNA lysidine(34) synthetase TilS [Pyrinomonadaceae bacterium]
MHKFTRNLLTEWRRLDLPFAGAAFIVAISGGADSVSLALALNELRNKKKLNLHFVLAHFNHNLRGEESVEDERFVKELAEKLEFELAVGIQHSESKIENQEGNLEQNARLARYEFLTETAKNLDADGILTAHTLNDQAETFLLNLIRGSGLDGLGGMKPIRIQNSDDESRIQNLELDNESKIQNLKSKIRLVRPLLRWAKREDTEIFCLLNEIEFRYDSMNEDLAFRRVRIRKVLLPLLKDFNPKIVETLGKTAALLRENAESLTQFLNSDAAVGDTESETETFSSKDGQDETVEVLLVKDLMNVFPSMRRFIVREWLKNKRGDLRRLSAKHFEAVENLILSRKSGNTIELPGGEIVVKKDGKLFYGKTTVEKN